mgnify:CR=1 FL=1
MKNDYPIPDRRTLISWLRPYYKGRPIPNDHLNYIEEVISDSKEATDLFNILNENQHSTQASEKLYECVRQIVMSRLLMQKTTHFSVGMNAILSIQKSRTNRTL